MSTHKTPNLSLHSWEESDRFDRTEINENFAAIDAAVGANAAALDDTGDVLTALADADAALSDRVTAAQSAAATAQSTATAAQTAAATAQSTASAAQTAANTAQATATAAQAAATAAAKGLGNTRTVWGSYVGTGTSGNANRNTLIFDGQPLCIDIYLDGAAAHGRNLSFAIGESFSTAPPNNNTIHVFWGNDRVSWYSTSLDDQFNVSGKTYYYIALLGD